MSYFLYYCENFQTVWDDRSNKKIVPYIALTDKFEEVQCTHYYADGTALEELPDNAKPVGQVSELRLVRGNDGQNLNENRWLEWKYKLDE